MTINEQKVKTPSTILTTSKLLMDEAGIYEVNNKKLAVNLLDEKESDVNAISKISNQKERQKLFQRESKERDFNLELAVLILAFLFMMAEFFYIKVRGDV